MTTLETKEKRIADLEELVRLYRHTCYHPFSKTVKACPLCKQADILLGDK